MEVPKKKYLYSALVLVVSLVQFISERRVIKGSGRAAKRQLVVVAPLLLDDDFETKNELYAPPTRIVVWGERASGASYAATVLERAFGSPKVYRYEHLLLNEVFDEDKLDALSQDQTDVLWVMVVRSPCGWADAMIRLQGSQMSGGKDLTYEEYYRLPWADLALDSDSPENNATYFADIFQLRKSKLILMSQVMKKFPRHIKIVRLNEFERNPHVLVEEIMKEYNFTADDEYEPNPPSKKIHPTVCMEYGAWIEAHSRIDWQLEGFFGYHPLDCHLCYENNRNNDNEIIERSIHGSESFLSSDESKSATIPVVDLRMKSPTSIYLLGERNSGTTFVSKTLAAAFPLPHDFGLDSDADQFAIDIPVFLHKHMFRHELLNDTELSEIKSRSDILWIMVVRSPCDWIEGMYRKPYHLCPTNKPERCGTNENGIVWLNKNNVRKLSFKTFFSEMKWVDWAESAPFPRKIFPKKQGKKSPKSSKLIISKVGRNFTYPNVISLRKHKMKLMQQVIDVSPRHVKIVRLKEVENDPNMFIQVCVSRFS
mmetsp:Transcript_581/g.1189  ORF Transcript_581/g.1189 Transcript_581/m.1189 type:complete len:540 (-) Transcript_581:483-2102(-)